MIAMAFTASHREFIRSLIVILVTLCLVAVAVIGLERQALPQIAKPPAHHNTATSKKVQDNKPVQPTPQPAKITEPVLTFGHLNIITSLFWVGEPADGDNGNITNTENTWDENWQQHFGGVDSPDARNGYLPAGFTPRENPFYVALPYSDLDSSDRRKASAQNCLRNSGNSKVAGSWCKNTWLAIKFTDTTQQTRVAYAQWEDAGPFGEDDTGYVFGAAKPGNTTNLAAGLDVSPAVSSYLGLSGNDLTVWNFVRTQDVPNGPWKQIVTTTPGRNAN